MPSLLVFIRSTMCPQANSSIKCEMRIFGGPALKSVVSSRRRSPPLFFPTALNFPQTMDRPRRQRVRRQSKARQFAHYRRGFSEVRVVTIIVDYCKQQIPLSSHNLGARFEVCAFLTNSAKRSRRRKSHDGLFNNQCQFPGFAETELQGLGLSGRFSA